MRRVEYFECYRNLIVYFLQIFLRTFYQFFMGSANYKPGVTKQVIPGHMLPWPRTPHGEDRDSQRSDEQATQRSAIRYRYWYADLSANTQILTHRPKMPQTNKRVIRILHHIVALLGLQVWQNIFWSFRNRILNYSAIVNCTETLCLLIGTKFLKSYKQFLKTSP